MGITFHYDVLSQVENVSLTGINTAIDYSKIESPVWWK